MKQSICSLVLRASSIGLVLLAGSGHRCPAADQPAADDQARNESLAALKKLAASFEIRLDERHVATREEEPALRWINTIGHATDAALFIWTCDGRPVAVGSAVINDGIVIGQECQSLALGPLRVKREGKTIWEPDQPGIEFRPLPDAPPPGETARKRLTQMKTLARRFRAQAIKSPPAYQENDARELRLLSQPIHQYHDPAAAEHEGAIFVFAMDTDPDVLLLLENRVRDGRAGWEYALARTNPYVLKVWLDDTLVWTQKRIVTATDPALPFFVAGPYPLKEGKPER